MFFTEQQKHTAAAMELDRDYQKWQLAAGRTQPTNPIEKTLLHVHFGFSIVV
jgi:hypothetical protein